MKGSILCPQNVPPTGLVGESIGDLEDSMPSAIGIQFQKGKMLLIYKKV
jgi:hypothetical protein